MAEIGNALDRMIGADPLTRALIDAVVDAVERAFDGRLPRLAYTNDEVGAVFGVGSTTVSAMVADGRLKRLGGIHGRITAASVFELAGWPVCPAPVADPLSVVPEAEAS